MNFVITVIILTAIFYGIYLLIKKEMDKVTTLKDTSLDTPLYEFKESHAVSTHVTKKGTFINNPVKSYEEMCIKNPLKYKDHPDLPKIISEYKKIIKGITPDYNGSFIPSQYILGKDNPDYYTYLKNQIKYNPSLEIEKKRILKTMKIEKVKQKLFLTLVTKGVPPLIANTALQSHTKLNNYTEKDWNTFCSVIQEYLQMTDRLTIMDFVEMFSSKEIVLNKEKFEEFLVLKSKKIPLDLIFYIIKDEISIEQAKHAIILVQDYGYSIKEAIKEILNQQKREIEEENLRKKYSLQRR
jgi:hypothetical protein